MDVTYLVVDMQRHHLGNDRRLNAIDFSNVRQQSDLSKNRRVEKSFE